jgi:hypothetical protein
MGERMKQHIEMVVKVKQIKEIHTRSGKFMYSFGVPITKMSGDTQLTEWVQVSILQDQQRPDLLNASEVHFIGSLTLREAYGQYPQGISIFGFYIEPILSTVYRQRKVKKNSYEDALQSRNVPQSVPQQQESGYIDPVAAANPQSDYIPM